MPGRSRSSSLLRNLWRLNWLGVSFLSERLWRRRPSRPATSWTFTPQLDPFEGRFYPGSMLAWGMPAWMGAAYVDRALTAPRSVEEVYWDEARTAASDAAQPALPWDEFGTPKPSPEASGAESASYQALGNAGAQASERGRTEGRFSFTGLTERDEGLSDRWTEDLAAGLLGSGRAAKGPGRLPPEQRTVESAASGAGLLGGGGEAAPSSAGASAAPTPVSASAAGTGEDKALLSALASLGARPSPATAAASTAVGGLPGSGGSDSNGPPPPSPPRSHQGVPHGRGP